MQQIPVLYNKKEECCGCSACYAICPKSAISMVEDEEGFEYPVIDENLCIRCNRCLQVCSFKAAEYDILHVFAMSPLPKILSVPYSSYIFLMLVIV